MLFTVTSLLSLPLIISAASNPNHARIAANKRAEGLAFLERNLALSSSPMSVLERKSLQSEKRRCKVRPASSSVASTSSTPAPSPTPSSEPVYVAPAAPYSSAAPIVEAAVRHTSTSTPPAPAATTPASSNIGGSSGASNEFPNGHIEWINSGINGGGWSPPYVHVNELKAADLGSVISSGNSPFGPCAPYMDKFYAIGSEFGIPAIMIASFAMQESTCNPSAQGQGGEQGMFQISQDKCGGSPGGNCKDVDFNMRTAMKYFSDTLAANGGDAFLSIGQYNGWYKGLTFAAATAARWTGCCRCQNNLDYLNEFVNGWMQGKNGYSMGVYNNLAQC